MKHKGIILISTILVFVLATILSFVWLLQIRHVEIYVVAEETEEIETYQKINSVIEANYKGKSYYSVKESDVIATLSKDPYINVKSVTKVFPDRLKIEVAKRKERFAILYIGEDNVTDNEYYLLKKVADGDMLGDEIIKITLQGISLREETLKLGQKIGADSDALVGYTTAIFAGFSDGVNLIEDVTVIGVRNWIRFNTKTGVVIEFSFANSQPSATGAINPTEASALVAKASEVESVYNALTESQKRTGYLLVYTKVSKEIAIEHVIKHAE